MSLENLKKALKEEKLKIGTDETIKLVKQEKVKEVFVAKNCSEEILKQLERACEIDNCTLSKLKETSKELGAVCKKPFSISVCCYIK